MSAYANVMATTACVASVAALCIVLTQEQTPHGDIGRMRADIDAINGRCDAIGDAVDQLAVAQKKMAEQRKTEAPTVAVVPAPQVNDIKGVVREDYNATLSYWVAINAVFRAYNAHVSSYRETMRTAADAAARCREMAHMGDVWSQSLIKASTVGVDPTAIRVGERALEWLTMLSSAYSVGATELDKVGGGLEKGGVARSVADAADKVATSLIVGLNTTGELSRIELSNKFGHQFPRLE